MDKYEILELIAEGRNLLENGNTLTNEGMIEFFDLMGDWIADNCGGEADE